MSLRERAQYECLTAVKWDFLTVAADHFKIQLSHVVPGAVAIVTHYAIGITTAVLMWGDKDLRDHVYQVIATNPKVVTDAFILIGIMGNTAIITQ